MPATKARDQARSVAIDELRRLVAEGLASGPGGPVDIASLKAEARERFLKAKQAS